MRARAVSLTAMFVAGAVVILYITGALPTMRIAFAAVAGLFTAAAVIEGGLGCGCLCFVATGILGALLVPERTGVVLYATFFGYYPLVKSAAERRGRAVIGWAVKAVVFLAVLTVYLFALSEIVLGDIPAEYLEVIPLVYLVTAAIFVVYDIGMTRLIGFYMVRIHKYRDWR